LLVPQPQKKATNVYLFHLVIPQHAEAKKFTFVCKTASGQQVELIKSTVFKHDSFITVRLRF